jgi:hypothetical protein
VEYQPYNKAATTSTSREVSDPQMHTKREKERVDWKLNWKNYEHDWPKATAKPLASLSTAKKPEHSSDDPGTVPMQKAKTWKAKTWVIPMLTWSRTGLRTARCGKGRPLANVRLATTVTVWRRLTPVILLNTPMPEQSVVMRMGMMYASMKIEWGAGTVGRRVVVERVGAERVEAERESTTITKGKRMPCLDDEEGVAGGANDDHANNGEREKKEQKRQKTWKTWKTWNIVLKIQWTTRKKKEKWAIKAKERGGCAVQGPTLWTTDLPPTHDETN